MALIDMLTDITSFNYETVGKKQGEYFGEDKATGFTPNRQTKNPTEYVENAITGLGTTDYFIPNYNPLESQNETSIHLTGTTPVFPGPVDYFTPDYNPLSDAESIHIMNPDGTDYFTPDYNPLEDSSIFESSFVNYFDDTHQTGLHLHPEHKVSNFVNQDGFTPMAVNYFGDENHPGFNLNISHGEDAESHYIIGSGNAFNFSEGSFTDMFDIDARFTSGQFVSEMVTTDFDTEDFGSNLITISYDRVVNARAGYGTNKPNLGDFGETAENSIEGDEGKYNTELRLRDVDELYEFKGGMAKALREPNNFGFDQPFIVHEIGNSYASLDFDEGIARGGVVFNVVRAAEDVIRMGKWTLTPKGMIWNLKQFLLQAQNAIPSTRLFNPLGVFGSIIPLVHLPRHTNGTFLDFSNPPSYPNDIVFEDTKLEDDKGFFEKLGDNIKRGLGVPVGNRLEDLYGLRFQSNVDQQPNLHPMAALGLGNNEFSDPKRIVDSETGGNPGGGEIPMGGDRIVPPSMITWNSDLTKFTANVEKMKENSDLMEKGWIKPTAELNSQGEDLKTYLKDDYPTRIATKEDLTTFPSIVESEPIEKSNVFNKSSTPVEPKEYNLGTSKIKVDGEGKLYSVGVSNTLQVPYGGKFDKLNWAATADNTLPKDFIKFRIRDAVNGKWLVFPAHIGTITDTVTPSWTTEKYIGRPDSIHLYGGADRSVSFDFKVAAFTKQEIPLLQEKMNYLVGLGYPTFKKILDSDDEERPVAPYIYLTIGDLFNNTPGYFSSIAITMEENATWELDEGHQIPQVFSVSVEFVHVGKYLPHTLGKHYEVPWLKDKGVGKNKFGTFKTDPRDGNTSRPEIENAKGKHWSKGITA